MGDPSVLLLEQNLADYRGHYYAYVKALADCLTDRGIPVRSVCNRRVLPEVAAAVRGTGHFSWNFNGLYPRYFRVWRHILGLAQRVWFRRVHKRFLGDLSRFPRDLQPTPDTVCYFSTLISPEVLAVATWLRGFPAPRRPRVAVMLRFRPDEPYLGRAVSERFYTRALRELASLDTGGRIALLSDSDLLAERYAALAGRRVGVLPIPHSSPPGAPSPAEEDGGAACAGGLDGPVRVAFLGRAAPEKGFAFLPDIFEAVREDIAVGRLDVVVQGPGEQDGGPDSPMGRVADRLRSLGATILPSPLSPDAYYRALEATHVVILPYDTHANEYLGTSGVFTEALSLGKPVIATAGTWMARQLEALGIGMVVPNGDIGACRDVIRRILSDPGPILERSRAAAPAWARHHSPGSVIDSLFASFTEQQGAANP